VALSSTRLRQLHEALVAAFPSVDDLRLLMTFELDVPLEHVAAGDQPIPTVVFALLQWAEAHGRIGDLVDGASRRNPGNPLLRTFREQFLREQGRRPDDPIRPQASSAAAPTIAELTGLAVALTECQALRSDTGRNDVVRDLDPEIGGRIQRRGDARSDVLSIVRTAANYPGGLSALLEIVHLYEGPSSAWQQVEEYLAGPLQRLGIGPGRAG
jgi:hypothetical protein